MPTTLTYMISEATSALIFGPAPKYLGWITDQHHPRRDDLIV